MNKIVLIGDIVKSKKIKGRSVVQRKLNRLFKDININDKSLDSPLTITLGDEFQALYKNADNLFLDIWEILFTLYPEKVRFSVGLGELSTKINHKQAIGMDGPAFYFAREGLIELKEISYLLNIKGEGINNTDLIRQSLFLISHTIEKWKVTRMKIFNSLLDDLSIKIIAKKLKLSDKAVYKSIDTGGMYIIIDILNEITGILNSTIKKA